jgi:hypothetical protein
VQHDRISIITDRSLPRIIAIKSRLGGFLSCHQYTNEERLEQWATYMDFAQETSDIRDLSFQEPVQRRHVRLFSEKYIVGEILQDLGNKHKAPTHRRTVLRG